MARRPLCYYDTAFCLKGLFVLLQLYVLRAERKNYSENKDEEEQFNVIQGLLQQYTLTNTGSKGVPPKGPRFYPEPFASEGPFFVRIRVH